MKKTYKIEVDCANCANLLEDAARKSSGVRTATVNFMTQKMIVFMRPSAGRSFFRWKGSSICRNTLSMHC